mmetsp:Transcript_7103/g.12569  ORF Transcript_7103/g.12569 Transcript_7103/m.12569 type:complete len:366 (+) Transcript_7103:262-1359(+)
MIPTIIIRIPLPMPRLKHHASTIHVTIPNQHPRPRLHPAFVLNQPMILESKHRVHLNAEQFHHISQYIQRRLDLGGSVLIDLPGKRRPRNHPLLLVDGNLTLVILPAGPRRKPLVILRARHLHGDLPRDGRSERVEVGPVLRFRETIVHVILLGIGQLLGISVPFGHIPGHFHPGEFVRVRFDLAERFAKRDDLRVRLELRVAVGKILGHEPVVAGAFVDHVRVGRVENRAAIDGVGISEDGIVSHFVPLLVQGDFLDVFVLRIEIVGILVAGIGIPFVVEFVLEIGFVPLTQCRCVDGAVVVAIHFEGVDWLAVVGEIDVGLAVFSKARVDFVEDAIADLGVGFVFDLRFGFRMQCRIAVPTIH